jgi:hypothetical protein
MEDTASIHWTLDHRRREIEAGKIPDPKERETDSLQRLDDWIKQPENIEILLNRELTKKHYKLLQEEKAEQKLLGAQRLRMKHQRLLMGYFYHQFSRSGLMERIVASYEMQPIYRDYCPPLVPQQVLQYLITPKNRKLVKTRLKRLKKLYGRTFRLRPLNRKVVQLERMNSDRKKRNTSYDFYGPFAGTIVTTVLLQPIERRPNELIL